MVSIYELMPVDGRKSFYGKCRVVKDDYLVALHSYDTFICVWNERTGTFSKEWSGYSATTMRHINAFMRHIGFNCGGKKWWESLPMRTALTISDLVNAG